MRFDHIRIGTDAADTFVFTSPAHGAVLHFQPDVDTIDLTAFHELWNLHWVQRDHGTLVIAPEMFSDAHNSIFLVGVDASGLQLSDFIY